jgi:hypothetical protein
MKNKIRVKGPILLFALFSAWHVQAADRMVGLGITLQKRILINFGYQINLSPTVWLRGRIYIAAGGRPVAGGLYCFKAEKTGTPWQPYLGAGLEVMPHRFHRKFRWTPYVCSTTGVRYQPHDNLADQVEFSLGYFPKLARIMPMGYTLWHYNTLE